MKEIEKKNKRKRIKKDKKKRIKIKKKSLKIINDLRNGELMTSKRQ